MWLARILCPFYLLAQLRKRRRSLFFRRWRPRPEDLPPAPRVWVHTLSVGELQAAATLVEGLRRRFPQCHPVLTVATVSGYEAASRRFGERFAVYPGPIHCPEALRRYVSVIDPRLFILVESDVWPDLLGWLRRRGVPLIFLNAAISEGSFRRLRRWPALARWFFGAFEVIGTASPEDRRRFVVLDPGPRILYLGNLKYDFPPPSEGEVEALRRELGAYLSPPVIVCGSTHAGEEELLLEARRRLSGGTLVLCPRRPERALRVKALAEALGFRATLRSRPGPCEVLVVDTLGELRALYALAEVAFVGGTLVPVGGHNLLEPASVGVPPVFGPYVESVSGVAAELEKAGGGFRVRIDPEDLVRTWRRVLRERSRAARAAREVWYRHRGALERHLDLLAPYLSGLSVRQGV